jgi:hypothetical protein
VVVPRRRRGIQHVGRAGLERGAETAPQASGESPGRSGHRHAARVARKHGREGVESRGQAPHQRRIGPFLRPVDLRTTLPWGLHVAEDDDPRAAESAAVRDRVERATAAVDGRRAADGHEHLVRSRLDGRTDQLAGPVRRGAPRIALLLRHESQAARRGHLDQRAAPVGAQQREGRLHGAPSGSCTGTRTMCPPSAASSTSSVPSPPSATGHGSAGTPHRSSPRASARATSTALNVPLNESGAIRTGRALAMAQHYLSRRSAIRRAPADAKANLPATGVTVAAHRSRFAVAT